MDYEAVPGPSGARPLKGSVGSSDNGDSDEELGECAICLGWVRNPIGNPSTCDHLFCLDCILEWAKSSNTCPQDRTQFPSITVREYRGDALISEREVTVGPAEEDETTCRICGRGDREAELLLCDGYDEGYHMGCLSPSLSALPGRLVLPPLPPRPLRPL